MLIYFFSFFFIGPLLLLWTLIRVYLSVQRNGGSSKSIPTVAFFHPYCNAGGGGERVLWVMLKLLTKRYPKYRYIVYTGDQGVEGKTILSKVATTFRIDLSQDVTFVYLKSRPLVEAEKYPAFTLLFQSLGSIVLGTEALFKFPPDLFIDTMGYAFTYPLFKYFGGCKVAAYVHYPTISVDMLANVSSRREAVNNRGFIASSSILSKGKLLYYQLFAHLYGFMGRRADIVIVNSSWTRNHIKSIWGNRSIHLVYPPCNTEVFQKLPIDGKQDYQIVSISQFRPEKDHIKQIHSFSKLLEKLEPIESSKARLVLIGSCRDTRDEDQVDKLRQICKTSNIEDKVTFALNLTFDQLLENLKTSNIGIHTMREEHFGIGIVELMAAGLIVVAHNSGGPKMDIIQPGETGFLAETVDEYADCLMKIVHSEKSKLSAIRSAARKHVNKFSEDNFCSQIAGIFDSVLTRS